MILSNYLACVVNGRPANPVFIKYTLLVYLFNMYLGSVGDFDDDRDSLSISCRQWVNRAAVSDEEAETDSQKCTFMMLTTILVCD